MLSNSRSSPSLHPSLPYVATACRGVRGSEEKRPCARACLCVQVALREVLSLDLPVEQCSAIVSAIDADGDGVINFKEFSDICKHGVGGLA